MSIKEELIASFKKGDVVTKLIYFNLVVFLLVNLVFLTGKLMLFKTSDMLDYVSTPAVLSELLHRPWTLLTFMFVHEGFIHILFNLINLYLFGRFFLMFFNQKQLLGLYFLGGFLGALTFLIALNVFPYFQLTISDTSLYGASASVLAIMTAVTMYSPNMEVHLILIGKVKLKYIFLVLVLISLFSAFGDHAGVNTAYFGGILGGYLFAVSIKRGKDLTGVINRIIDFFVDLFARKSKLKVTYNKRSFSDAEWNENKKNESDLLDAILDKIKKSGYESLSENEKKKLFNQGSENK